MPFFVAIRQYTEQSADRQVDHKYAILRNQQHLREYIDRLQALLIEHGITIPDEY